MSPGPSTTTTVDIVLVLDGWLTVCLCSVCAGDLFRKDLANFPLEAIPNGHTWTTRQQK